MSKHVIQPDLVSVLKKLRLGRILDTLATRLDLARSQSMDIEDFLLLVLGDEVARRDSSAAERRAENAGLDRDMTFERWDKSAKISYDKRLLTELASLRFLSSNRHVVILGPVGVGKTFLASALAHVACQNGYRVIIKRADLILRELRQSRLDNSREALMTELTTVDLLVIDDFALEPMTRDESRDVYQLFVERTGRASTIVTSNRDTSEWLAMFDDVLQAQSAIDRFKNAAYDLVVEGESYRARLKPKLDDSAVPNTSGPVPKPVLIGRKRRR
jgi:DNA replication protein DnaC